MNSVIGSLQAIVRALLWLTCFSVPAMANGSNMFFFVAFGDMPYWDEDVAKVDQLIAAINKEKPEFVIHVGDIMRSGTSCTDESYSKAIKQINTVEAPVVYSIGDNEWIDCNDPDPRARLAALRKIAFPKPGLSLGNRPMAVESQAIVMPRRFSIFVENQRFFKNRVVFIVPHVPGEHNGLGCSDADPKAIAEYQLRNAANVAWIDAGFKKARASKAKAVVVAFQAHPYPKPCDKFLTSPYFDTVNAIERGALSFGRPVLVIFGGEHKLDYDEKFRNVWLKPIANVWRLQLMGEKNIGAVKILVDPDNQSSVFSFVPIYPP